VMATFQGRHRHHQAELVKDRRLVVSALRKPARVQKEGVMKSGIRKYARSTTNSMCAVGFVEAGTSELLSLHLL
jgi:hypothetical protein